MTTEEMYLAGLLTVKHLANSLVATAAMGAGVSDFLKCECFYVSISTLQQFPSLHLVSHQPFYQKIVVVTP